MSHSCGGCFLTRIFSFRKAAAESMLLFITYSEASHRQVGHNCDAFELSKVSVCRVDFHKCSLLHSPSGHAFQPFVQPKKKWAKVNQEQHSPWSARRRLPWPEDDPQATVLPAQSSRVKFDHGPMVENRHCPSQLMPEHDRRHIQPRHMDGRYETDRSSADAQWLQAPRTARQNDAICSTDATHRHLFHIGSHQEWKGGASLAITASGWTARGAAWLYLINESSY